MNLEESTGIIIEQASQLVNQLINIKGNNTPPFLPEEFARMKGVKRIEEADLGNTAESASAVLLRSLDGSVIKINRNHHPVRRRFSCAHEVGHILFNELGLERYVQTIEYRTFDPQRQGEVRSSARERLCDIAATELLMPESIFKRYLSDLGVSINSVERLACTFGVSIPSAAFRIAEVSSEPCLGLRWQPRLRQIGQPLKLAGCVGPGVNFSNRGNWTPVHDIIRRPSVLHEAYKQNTAVKSYKQFRRGGIIRRLAMESKAFGQGDWRYVVSLAFLKA